MTDRREAEERYRHVQETVTSFVGAIDRSAQWVTDRWERPGGGGGESRTLAGEGPIERAAVNFSAVWGEVPSQLSERLEGLRFYATGVSLIVHPANPYAPTIHANLRYFETEAGGWFGGGADLTPYYLFEEDAVHFHGVLAGICRRHPPADYSSWKRACDEYFHLPHRGEARGVGGIFFDRSSEAGLDEVQLELGEGLEAAYRPILERRVGAAHGPGERYWQELRRGRYVEFNLVWDRGTRFGLETGGRTASVLSSLPPRARWDETFQPAPGSPEHHLLDLLRGPPREWTA